MTPLEERILMNAPFVSMKVLFGAWRMALVMLHMIDSQEVS